MLLQSKIILLIIIVDVVFAWLPPERCKQGNFLRSKRDSTAYPTLISSATAYSNLIIGVPVTNNITQIAINQNKYLNETYNDAKFFGVPIRGSIDDKFINGYKIYIPNNCKFHTYNPSPLATVYCQEGVACTLVHTVSTTKSYTASEGYNWGVKISTKASLPFIFDVGGEVSAGGTYSCTYTEGRTTTDTVQCTVASGAGKTLQLYNVQSDMECQFSTVTMVPEWRIDGRASDHTDSNLFTYDERKTTINNAIIHTAAHGPPLFLPDLDRMSDELMEKLNIHFPYYSPYTDLMIFTDDTYVMYHKEANVAAGPKRIIPFTSENGNSIQQYACVLT